MANRPAPDGNHAAELLLQGMPEGVVMVDETLRVLRLNPAAERLSGVSGKNAVGRPCSEVMGNSVCDEACPLRETFQTGRPVIARRAVLQGPAGERVQVSVSTALIRNEAGTVIGGVETYRDLRQRDDSRGREAQAYQVEGIVSKSAAMAKLFEILPAVADSSATVLIDGESGVGKGMLARAIHNRGPRQDAPLLTVNCSALPDSLLEAELFGYKAGAFTDAKKDKPGWFAAAGEGTLLLDEIGDISPAMQVRLLRVLQDRVFTPLGSVTEQPLKARVIAATHRDLEARVEQERFRLDLYFRINVMHLRIPPLRERREDIPVLLAHLIDRFNRNYRKGVTGVSRDVLSMLMQHEFPGNVRELENLLEHAFILCEDDIIDIGHLPLRFTEQVMPQKAAIAQPPPSFADIEREHLIDALEQYQWNRSRTARALGIHKATLFRKIRKLGIELPETDGRHRSNRDRRKAATKKVR